MASEAEQILTDEVVQLKKLRQIVKNSIEDENLIMENLAHPPSEILNMGQRISDKIARFGGSWTFIIFFLIILVINLMYNKLTCS